MKSIRKLSLLIISALLICFLFCRNSSAEIYKYKDKNGTTCYSDNINSVPEKYRGKTVIVKELPESIVRKSPTGLQKIFASISDFTNFRKFKTYIPMLIAVSIFIVSIIIMSAFWRKNKRKISLILKKNRPVQAGAHTGQICLGFDNCTYPDSIQKIKRYEHDNSGRTSFFEHKFCKHRLRTNETTPYHRNMTIEKFEKFMADNSLCYHPAEFIESIAWRCHKCNSIVSSERERHC